MNEQARPLRFGLITISDRSSRGERPDLAGPALAEMVQKWGWVVIQAKIIPDSYNEIRNLLTDWADSRTMDIILTTGGTGFAPSDVTPEATQSILDKSAPGISEAIRSAGLLITPHAILSRAIAGIRKSTLILNLPGSPKGAIECLEVIISVLPHAVQLLRGDPDSEKGHTVGIQG